MFLIHENAVLTVALIVGLVYNAVISSDLFTLLATLYSSPLVVLAICWFLSLHLVATP